MNKNFFLFCFLVIALTGCSDSGKNPAATEQPKQSQTARYIQESEAAIKQKGSWQTAYMDIIKYGGGSSA